MYNDQHSTVCNRRTKQKPKAQPKSHIRQKKNHCTTTEQHAFSRPMAAKREDGQGLTTNEGQEGTCWAMNRAFSVTVAFAKT